MSEIGGGTSRYYTYDAAGNRIKAIVDTANTIQYTYDSDGRLTSETQTIGQTSTVINYTYDANGNLIKKKEGAKSTTYAFDVWGNMISAAGASYTYNAQGLRISKTVNKKKTSFTLINGKVWSDGTYRYVWGAELVTNGSVYYLYNAHGDVVQLVNASGTVTKTYDYEAYGNELKRDAADTNPFRYCGEYYDVETGFIYLRARYYDPSVGRFISKDPHWNVGNMIYGDDQAESNDDIPSPDINSINQSGNLYVYCMNNPVNYADYTGNMVGVEGLLLLLYIAVVGCAATLAVKSAMPLIEDISESIPSVWDRPAPLFDFTTDEPKVEEKTEVKTITIADARRWTKKDIVIFRFGFANSGAAALVPTETDYKSGSGLSFSLIPCRGAGVTTIEMVNMTGVLHAIQDSPKHVGVYPIGGTLKDWYEQGADSIWTQALLQIIKLVV